MKTTKRLINWLNGVTSGALAASEAIGGLSKKTPQKLETPKREGLQNQKIKTDLWYELSANLPPPETATS